MGERSTTRCVWRGFAIGVAALALGVSMIDRTHSQEPAQPMPPAAGQPADAPRQLWEEDPYDLITLTPDQQNAQLKVVPLTVFPGRVTPPKAQWPTGALRFRLPDKGQKEFEVNWNVIANVEPFEKLLVDEATRRTTSGDFDKAYACYDLLQRRYPNFPGVKEGIERFLFVHAGDSFKKGRYDEALSLLEDAFLLRKDNAGVIAGIERVTNAVVDARIKAGRFRDAREILSRTEQHFGEALKPVVDRWRGQMQMDAGALQKAANDHFTAGKLREAYLAARRMHVIWPGLPGAADLQSKISAAYPAVSIGVVEPIALPAPETSWPSWPQRRVAPLQRRPLVVYQSPGEEGGKYQCPFGTLEFSADGKQLLLRLPAAASGPTGYDIAAKVAALADRRDAHYSPGWSELMSKVEVHRVREVEITLRRPALRPEAWLLPLDFAASHSPGAVAYRATAEPSGDVRLFWPEGTPPPNPTQPREIEERKFTDSAAALEALERGEIDAVDRLLPATARRAVGQKGITVRSFAVPTVHAIVPNASGPRTANRTFRRALVYGLDREKILRNSICGGEVAGCRVISGPFPAGVDRNDFSGYANHPQIEPRPYDARLGAALTIVAEGELAELAKREGKSPPSAAPLKLIYPPTEIARLAAPQVAAQWKAIGIEVETQEVADIHAAPHRQADLRYVELSFVEPLVEANIVFGPEGLLASSSPYVQRSLDRIRNARTWNDARERLRELHRLAHEEVAIVPLWQIAEQAAFRSDLQGPPPKISSLYQNIEGWKIVPSSSP